jgi:hypothetical protein
LARTEFADPNLAALDALRSKSAPVTASPLFFRDMPMALIHGDAPFTEEAVHHYDGAVGGWGSLKGLSEVVLREKPGPVELGEELLRQNYKVQPR